MNLKNECALITKVGGARGCGGEYKSKDLNTRSNM
jgi:hypothetical protein